MYLVLQLIESHGGGLISFAVININFFYLFQSWCFLVSPWKSSKLLDNPDVFRHGEVGSSGTNLRNLSRIDLNFLLDRSHLVRSRKDLRRQFNKREPQTLKLLWITVLTLTVAAALAIGTVQVIQYLAFMVKCRPEFWIQLGNTKKR